MRSDKMRNSLRGVKQTVLEEEDEAASEDSPRLLADCVRLSRIARACITHANLLLTAIQNDIGLHAQIAGLLLPSVLLLWMMQPL
jgi:hypothetical protein